MARSRVRLNSGGMQDLLNGAVAAAACEGPAQRVLGAAKSGAPVDSGEYVSSLHIEVDSTDRTRYKVIADVGHAAAVEARTGNLARALGSA